MEKREQHPSVGFNLVSWGWSQADKDTNWEEAVNEINALGVRNLTVVTYRFVNRHTGTISPTSIHGMKGPPADDTIAATIRGAKSLGMTVSLNPFIELDDPRGIGTSWRGDLDFPESGLRAFFATYGDYIEEMANLAQTTGAHRIYVGSELAALSRNPATQPFWAELIRRTRKVFNGEGRRLTYAANHDEFETVPFWKELDEIGVDAYFPLATRAEAAGQGNPAVSTIITHWRRHLKRLRRFAERQNKPIIISEWGVVPFDLTTYQPWNWRPSDAVDTTEQLNAYRATLEATQFQGDWLTDINFWHWRMLGNEGSQYGIAADSMVGRLIGRFIGGERINDYPD